MKLVLHRLAAVLSRASKPGKPKHAVKRGQHRGPRSVGSVPTPRAPGALAHMHALSASEGMAQAAGVVPGKASPRVCASQPS